MAAPCWGWNDAAGAEVKGWGLTPEFMAAYAERMRAFYEAPGPSFLMFKVRPMTLSEAIAAALVRGILK